MEDRGPFDRILQPEPAHPRDRTATIVVAIAIVLGLILLVLVLPPISIFSGGGSTVSGPVSAKARDQSPPPPAGFEAVSALFDLVSKEPVRQAARLTVNLSVTVHDSDKLFLFTYQGNRWSKLSDATPVAGGSAARGEVPLLPSNIAVFRQASETRAVLGSLPSGSELDPQALDSLTTLNIGGFFPASDGSVTGDAPQLPSNVNVAVAPTIGASDADQIAVLNAILASPDLRSAHVQAIANFVRDGQYAGIDLDDRAMDPANGAGFTSLVRALSSALRADGKSLTLTLPLPTHQGAAWDTHGFDWQTLAPLVDAIKLAPEPEQDQYYQRMVDVLGYLTPLVGGSKLLLAISPFSHERGVDGVHELTLTEALTEASVPSAQPGGAVAPGATVQALCQNLASTTGGSDLRWDDAARAVTFGYTGAGGARTVWLANVFSESFKLDLARRYELGGVAIDDVSKRGTDANIWPAVRQYAQTGEVALSKPNGALLAPSWTASGGTLASESGATVAWQAPAQAGTYTLTLVVSDGVTRVGQQLQVSVETSAAGGP
jgi:spore germination protein